MLPKQKSCSICFAIQRFRLKQTLTLTYLKAVLDAQEGQNASFFAPLHSSKEWTQINERMYYVIKAESHNHPTAISPLYVLSEFIIPLSNVLGVRTPWMCFKARYAPQTSLTDSEIINQSWCRDRCWRRAT